MKARAAELYLKSLLPVSIKKRLEEREVLQTECEKEDKKNLVQKLCAEDGRGKDNNSIEAQLGLTLCSIPDRSLQRLLREINNVDLELAMKIMSGKARKRVFDNMSQRLAVMIAEDMEYRGWNSRRESEQACIIIAKKFIKLVDCYEIPDYDTSMLKLMVSIYENADKHTKELEEKYWDVAEMIDKIYHS